MPKTDSELEVIQSVGSIVYAVPAVYAGCVVARVAGGVIMRGVAPLPEGAVLTEDERLLFMPQLPGGTLTLVVRRASAEFSGQAGDLEGEVAPEALPGYAGATAGQVLTRTGGGVSWEEVAPPLIRLSEVVPRNADVTGNLSDWGSDSGRYTFRLRAREALSIASIQIPRMMYDGSVGATLHLLDGEGVPLASGTVFRVNDGVEQADLNRSVSIGAGSEFRVRLDTPFNARNVSITTLPFTSPDGLIEVLGTTSGMPYAPPVRFLAGPTLPKTVQGPLDPADLPGYAGAAVGAALTRSASGLEWVEPQAGATGATLPRLSAAASGYVRFSPRDVAVYNFAMTMFAVFTPTANTRLGGLRYEKNAGSPGLILQAKVYRVSDQQLLGASGQVNSNGVDPMELPFAAAVTLTANTPYMIGLRAYSAGALPRATQTPTSYPNFTVSGPLYYNYADYDAYPPNSLNGYYPTFDLMDASGLPKGVVGPLDPADLPGYAGAAAGQLLARTASGVTWVEPPEPLEVGGNGSVVALSQINPEGFIVQERVPSQNNYRCAGPVIAAGAQPVTYAEARVPVRNTTSAGAHVVLLQVNLINSLVMKSVQVVLAGGETELVFPGPFTVPANERHAFIVGVVEGGWGDYVALFYGAGSGGGGYPAPHTGVNTILSDAIPSVPVGAQYTGLTGENRAQYRVVNLLSGPLIPKGVIGPLDPADLPGYAGAVQGQVLRRRTGGVEWVDVSVTQPPAVLGSGQSVLDGTPELNFASTMNSNTYGTTLDLRFEAVQDFTFRALRMPLRHYLYPGAATIEAHRTDSSYATSAQTRVAGAQVVLTKTKQTLDVTLDADVNIPAGQHLVLRFIPQGGDLVELAASAEGLTLPYALANGFLKFTRGHAADMSVVGNRIPQVSFLSQLVKNVLGQLDPRDLKGFAGASAGQVLSKGADGAPAWVNGGGAGGTGDLDTILAALRAPQMVDGLVYATSELNYDSQRDGWGEIEPHTYDQTTRYTDYYQLGVMGELYTGTGGTNGTGASGVRRTQGVGATYSQQLADGEVASANVTVLETVPCMGIAVGLPTGGVNSGAAMTFNVRVTKDGQEIFTQNVPRTKSQLNGNVTVVAMPDVAQWTPGAYVMEYRIVTVNDPALRTVQLDPTTTPADGIRVPFATEDFLLRVNGAPVGVNGMLAMVTEWKNPTLSVPQTVAVSGSDLIVQGSGLALRRTAAAPLPRTLNGRRHRAIIEFTPEPVAGADHYRFSVGVLSAAPTLPGDFKGISLVALQAMRGTYGGANPPAGDTLPYATYLRAGISPFRGLNATAFNTVRRLRLEVSIQFEAFQNFYGVNVEAFRPTITLFDAESGATLHSTADARNDLDAPNGQPISPALYVAAYAGFAMDLLQGWQLPANTSSYGWTEQNRYAWPLVPSGTEKPARVRVHRWVEWRE